MNIIRVTKLNARRLFEYWNDLEKRIPYFFQVDYEEWFNCLFHDQSDFETTFIHIETYMVEDNGIILGFIQYGQPHFHWNYKGEKYPNPQIGVIRNIYFYEERDDIGKLLLEKAVDYFLRNNLQPYYAFYHALGMSCNAGHGKLHNRMIHIDHFLKSHGFEVEHENVYYRIDFSKEPNQLDQSTTIEVKSSEITKDHKQSFELFENNLKIGGAHVNYLSHVNTVYLISIWIKQEYIGKGYGTLFIRNLIEGFVKDGYTCMDTDTANNNLRAQRYYEKNGFCNLGNTRSYIKSIDILP